MPLNISIDVDGTLLDENDNPVLHARETLQGLKNQGHCLQLWSAGGADYAHKHAVKHKLTDLFESYAKKPDVAIDDLPLTARPVVTVHVDQQHTLEQAGKKVPSIEQNVDAALTLSSKLASFVAELQAQKNRIVECYGSIIPGIPLHPVPFFGVIDRAKVITVGLNPSPTEFMEAGRWPHTLTASELTERLVHYFRLPHITPHHWFAELQWALEILHCPYHFAAAHVDASPWTTHTPSYLAEQNRNGLNLYNDLLDDGVQTWLPKTLQFCNDTVKLVIICPSSDKPKSAEAARLLLIEGVIQRSLGQTVRIVKKPKDQVPRWAWENREELIRLLDLEEVFP